MLLRREYRPILRAAYFESSDPQFRNKFSLELTKPESVSLCQAFDRKASAAGGKRPQPLSAASAGPSAGPAPAAAQRYAPVCLIFTALSLCRLDQAKSGWEPACFRLSKNDRWC